MVEMEYRTRAITWPNRRIKSLTMQCQDLSVIFCILTIANCTQHSMDVWMYVCVCVSYVDEGYNRA
jgi:hypothetical protein